MIRDLATGQRRPLVLFEPTERQGRQSKGGLGRMDSGKRKHRGLVT